MAGDVEEGHSDPAPFSRRRMRSEGLHAVEGVDCGGLRRVFDRLFGDIDLSRSLYLTGDNSYCPDYPYYLTWYLLYSTAEPLCTSPGRICLIQVN